MKMPAVSLAFRHGLWRNDRAIHWYRTPIPELQHGTAERLASTGTTDAVVS